MVPVTAFRTCYRLRADIFSRLHCAVLWLNRLLQRKIMKWVEINQTLAAGSYDMSVTSGPTPSAESQGLQIAMEQIKERLKLDALRDPSKTFGFDFREDVIVLKYFQPRLSIHEPGLWSSTLWSSSLSEDLAITRSN
jgi:hypothetical protein